MDNHFHKLCEMIAKQFKCREHSSKYSFYSIKTRGLFCPMCIGEFKYEGPDPIHIISENCFYSAICYLSDFSVCEIHNKTLDFYCKYCFDFHCRQCAAGRCAAYLIALNDQILRLDEHPEFILPESTVKNRKLSTYNPNSQEYFEFFKFQLKKFKKRKDFSMHFNNKTFDFNNSRIVTNKNYVNIADVSEDTIQHDFTKLSKLGKAQSARVDPRFPEATSESANVKNNAKLTSERSFTEDNYYRKAKENSGAAKKNYFERSSNNNNIISSSNSNNNIFASNPFVIKKPNDDNFSCNISNSNAKNKNDKRSSTSNSNNKQCVDDSNWQNYNNLETNKNASEKKQNNEKANYNNKENLQTHSNNLNLNQNKIQSKLYYLLQCFTYSFYINNRLKLNIFSLNFENEKEEKKQKQPASNYSYAIEAIESLISTRKISKRIFERFGSEINLFKKQGEGKNLTLISKLANSSTEFLINDSILLKKDPKHKELLKLGYSSDSNFLFFYNPNNFEIHKITFTGSEKFFSFLELNEQLIEEVAETVLLKLFVGKGNDKELRKNEDKELKSKYLNAKLLFSYLEIFGITSDNKIIGIMRNQAFFSINISDKEFKICEILSLDYNENTAFHNMLNLKNPKIEVDLGVNNENNNINNNFKKNSNTEKKVFYYITEENSFDNRTLKFFTQNVTKQENKFELFVVDEKLPKVYFTNILNEYVNCFYVYLSKENYELYCKLNNLEIKGDKGMRLFLVYLLENKIVKFVFNFEKNLLEFFSEKLIKKEKQKNLKPRSAYSNVKNYDNLVFFLNEDFQLIMFNFFTDEFKILNEFI